MKKYEEVERKRSELYSEYKKNKSIGILLIVLGIVLLIAFSYLDNIVPFIVIAIVLNVVGVIFINKSSNLSTKFKKMIKNELVDKVLREHFENFSYNKDSYIPISKINQAGLVMKPDKYKGEDLIVGEYKNVEFFVSDMILEERQVIRTKNGVYVTYVPYFQGRWYVYKFPKKFSETIKILERNRGANLRGLSKYETEMIEFNKKFSIYSSSEQFFYYIINPYMIERLLMLENNHRGTIYYALFEDELHIAIDDNSDSLEISINQKIDQKVVDEFEKDIKMIKFIIDDLYLDDVKFRR